MCLNHLGNFVECDGSSSYQKFILKDIGYETFIMDSSGMFLHFNSNYSISFSFEKKPIGIVIHNDLNDYF